MERLDGAPQSQSYDLLQGKGDQFMSNGQLLPDHLEKACAAAGMKATVRLHDDYDHSYYFIASFMGEHLRHHAQYLK